MGKGFRFFPDQASALAGEVDLLYFFLVGVSSIFAALIFFLIYIFAVKYRRRSEDEVPKEIPGLLKLELVWSIIPLLLTMVVFAWGATLYFDRYTPPEDAMEIYVVGKQWMWHIQHPTGQREINELHIPVSQPVKLTMASEDVIHSFYIPAFRIKKRCCARKIYHHVVRSDQTGRISFVLRRILWHQTQRNDRQGCCYGTGRLPRLACRW